MLAADLLDFGACARQSALDMEVKASEAVAPSRELLVHAMAMVRDRRSGAPLLDAGDVLATACVVAAVLHPEWAAAVSLLASAEIRALAHELVMSCPVAFSV